MQIFVPLVFSLLSIAFGSYSLYRINNAAKKISENSIKQVFFWLSILTVLLVFSIIAQSALLPEQIDVFRTFFLALDIFFIVYITFVSEELGRFCENFGFKGDEKIEKKK